MKRAEELSSRRGVSVYIYIYIYICEGGRVSWSTALLWGGGEMQLLFCYTFLSDFRVVAGHVFLASFLFFFFCYCCLTLVKSRCAPKKKKQKKYYVGHLTHSNNKNRSWKIYCASLSPPVFSFWSELLAAKSGNNNNNNEKCWCCHAFAPVCHKTPFSPFPFLSLPFHFFLRLYALSLLSVCLLRAGQSAEEGQFFGYPIANFYFVLIYWSTFQKRDIVDRLYR